MAKHTRKPAKPPVPLTRHPAFPAVIALWFGALFGLGSLAIRPGLIESLVLKAHIDTLIPAAAPPLGVTARICMALGLAVIGGLLGAKLAQFIARPRADEHKRKRGAAAINTADLHRRVDNPDAPPRMPISAHAELGEDGLDSDRRPAANPERRRALTAAEQDSDFTVPEFAPLPGGSPQVIDLGELDLAGSELEPAESALAAIEGVPAGQQFQVEGRDDSERQVFGRPTAAAQPSAPPAPGDDEAAPGPAGAAAAPEAAAPLSSFAAPVAPPIDFSRPNDVLAAANAARTELPPLFQQPAKPASPVTPSMAEAAPATSFDPAATPAPITAEAVAEAAAVALDSLGLVELTERFAASLRKRRAALAASAAAVEVPAAAAPIAEAVEGDDPAGFTVPRFAVPQCAVPEAAVEVEITPELEAAPPDAAPASEPVAVEPVAPELPPAPIAMPAALRPVTLDEFDEDEDLATYLPLRHIPMPQVQPEPTAPLMVDAALLVPPPHAAPVADDAAPGLVPQASVAERQSAAPEPESAPESVPESAEDAAIADGYSSLLDMSKPVVTPRQGFVRIEEPEPENAAIEPVVIFPGQSARQSFRQSPPLAQPSGVAPSAELPAQAEAIASTGAGDAAPLRRFDSPSNAIAGQQVAAQFDVPEADPAETERALRAALATLQRMSGAA